MDDLLVSLVNAIVNAAGSAAGNDAYHKISKMISQRLGRFHSRAALDKKLNETRKHLLVSPESYQIETEGWLNLLEEIVERNPAAENSMRALRSDISVHQSEFTVGKQNVGIVYGPQTNLFIDPKVFADLVASGREISTDQDEEEESDDQETENAGSSPLGVGWLIAPLVVLAAVILLLSHSCGGSAPVGDRFPSRGDRWPKGATVAAVMAPVAERLSACAQAPNLSPVNCPQSQSDGDSSNVSNVHWGLHGDPMSGAKIVYLDKQFQVAGNAVMDVTYTDESGAEFTLDLVHYRAWVNWNNGQPQLISITSFVGGAPPSIRKRNPGVPWPKLASAVQAAFDSCASLHVAPLPPQCPTESDSTISGGDARWQMNNDPLLNAQASFNSTWGVINVTGSFAMSASYSVFMLGRYHSIEAGNYDALVTLDGTTVHVLEITAN